MANITPLRGEGRTVGRITGTWGECLAEFFGTFVLIVFGDGVVAMAVAALPGSGRTATPTTIFDAAGDWLLITFGWAFAVVMGVYVAGGVSGEGGRAGRWRGWEGPGSFSPSCETFGA